MKRCGLSIVVLLVAIIAFAQERNYYAEAEQAFQRCEYAKAANLYGIAQAMTDRNTSAKQELCEECADAQEKAREHKKVGNLEQAKVYYEKLLKLNPDDAEANTFVSKYAQSTPGESEVETSSQSDESEILNDALSAYHSGFYDKALTLFLKINDNPTAQHAIGYMYEKGKGVSTNYSEAANWYRKAAEQGHVLSQSILGLMYHTGKGVAKDYAEAARWYRKAVEHGNAEAQCNLGSMYAEGKGVAKDYSTAVSWYRKAAEQGNAVAQYNLGEMYEYGKGVAKDYSTAVSWYRKAAEQGDAGAQYKLKKLGEDY